jgi:aconitate hydratase
MKNSFGSRGMLRIGARDFEIHRLDALEKQGLKMGRLPYSIRILLENLLRREDGVSVTADMIRALAAAPSRQRPTAEISFMPARFLLQDLTGVPAIVDLAAMRDAVASLGGDAGRVNPLAPADMVIDHSVQVDSFGKPSSFKRNADLEYERNRGRYEFLRWGQQAFETLAIVPPDTGICHQINLEFLAQVVFVGHGEGGRATAYPDTVIGTDSHTPMVNSLGVLGWGVGGIEAESAMLGQPIWMVIPRVVGVRLSGALPPGATATDLVLTITQRLRKQGVVGMFVEYFGPGLASLPIAHRATVANMSPENGSTVGTFPVDQETLDYLRLSGRSEDQVRLVEAYYHEQGLFHTPSTPQAEYFDVVDFDLASVQPSIAGPQLPQERIPLSDAAAAFTKALPTLVKPRTTLAAEATGLRHGSVVIAAITSCTNTSNPALMLAAGLVAKKAVEKGLKIQAWVKTSLAPGSRVVTDYLEKAGLTRYLDELGFNLVGYGCTTCIGNSGPLPKAVADEIEQHNLVAVSVLSGNRNFEGRIHPEVRANYLMSPALVVAFALAGHVDWDTAAEPIAPGVYLKDIWPSDGEIDDAMHAVCAEMFRDTYKDVFGGNARWKALPVPSGATYAWDPANTYVQKPPYFDGMTATPPDTVDITGARVLLLLGNSVTTDDISPAGGIKADSPAGKYLIGQGVKEVDFNHYGARRGNHQVLMRGAFANAQLRNMLVPDKEGPFTCHFPDGKMTTIFEAAEQYRREKTPLVILAGSEYGSGSSRDWAAKGPLLLGVRAVIIESIERIHRSNLIGMGVLPLQFPAGKSAKSLGLTGAETFAITGIKHLIDHFEPGNTVKVTATGANGAAISFDALVRIDTPQEAEYYRHGGILQFVIRGLLAQKKAVSPEMVSA